MYLVAIAWMYVALMMAAAEALHPAGSALGALITFVLYGLMPLAIVLYILNTPHRRRARHLAPRQTDTPPQAAASSHASPGTSPPEPLPSSPQATVPGAFRDG